MNARYMHDNAFVVDLSEHAGIPEAVFMDIDRAKRWAEIKCHIAHALWERQTCKRTQRRALFLMDGPESVAAVIREVPLNPGNQL